MSNDRPWLALVARRHANSTLEERVRRLRWKRKRVKDLQHTSPVNSGTYDASSLLMSATNDAVGLGADFEQEQ